MVQWPIVFYKDLIKIMILMDTLLTGSFQNALYGTNVKKTKTNSSRTGKVVIAESSRRQATLRHVYGVSN